MARVSTQSTKTSPRNPVTTWPDTSPLMNSTSFNRLLVNSHPIVFGVNAENVNNEYKKQYSINNYHKFPQLFILTLFGAEMTMVAKIGKISQGQPKTLQPFGIRLANLLLVLQKDTTPMPFVMSSCVTR